MIAKPENTHWLGRACGIASLTALALACFTVAAPAQEHKEGREKKEHGEK